MYSYQSNIHIDADDVETVKDKYQKEFASKLQAGDKSVRPTVDNKHDDGITVKGGNEKEGLEVGEWMGSVREWNRWRVIEYCELQPVYTLLDKGRRDIIEDILAPPKPPEARHLPITMLLHIITHKGNDQAYPFNLIHGRARTVGLEDDAPHQGDGLHAVVFPEPGKYDYKVFKAAADDAQASPFLEFVKGLKPFTLILLTETWSVGYKPSPHSSKAREAIFEGLRILGLDDSKNDLHEKLGTDKGWLFIGYKDMESPKAVVLSRGSSFYLAVSATGGRMASVGLDEVGKSKVLLDFPDPDYQHRFLATHGWVTTTVKTRTTTLIDREEMKKVTVKKVEVDEDEKMQ